MEKRQGWWGLEEEASKSTSASSRYCVKQSHGTLGSPVGLLLDRNRQAASALALHRLLACWSTAMIMVVVMKMDRSGRLLCLCTTPGCTMAPSPPPFRRRRGGKRDGCRVGGAGWRRAMAWFLGICLFAANSGLRAQQRQAAGPPQCDWPRRLDRARAGLPRPATRANSELVKTPSDLFLHARLAFLNPASCSQLPVPDSPPSTCPSCSSPSANPLRPKTNARTAIVARRSHFGPAVKEKRKKNRALSSTRPKTNAHADPAGHLLRTRSRPRPNPRPSAPIPILFPNTGTMFATKTLRQAAVHAERIPSIRFLGKRTIPGMSTMSLSLSLWGALDPSAHPFPPPIHTPRFPGPIG